MNTTEIIVRSRIASAREVIAWIKENPDTTPDTVLKEFIAGECEYLKNMMTARDAQRVIESLGI